jgi:hypothetical protein
VQIEKKKINQLKRVMSYWSPGLQIWLVTNAFWLTSMIMWAMSSYPFQNSLYQYYILLFRKYAQKSPTSDHTFGAPLIKIKNYPSFIVADLCHSCFCPATPPSEKSRINKLKGRVKLRLELPLISVFSLHAPLFYFLNLVPQISLRGPAVLFLKFHSAFPLIIVF